MSLRFILMDTTCFSKGDDRAQTEADLIWMIEALSQRNQSYLRQRPNTVRMYKSGCVWQKPAQFNGDVEEVARLKKALGSAAKSGAVKDDLALIQEILGGERFRDIGRIIENKGGDCDNLAAWRVAELRQMGIAARPMMTSRTRPDGGTTYHAIVRWPPFGDDISGNPYEETDEDPSLLLGMAQPQRKAERDEEIRKNLERCDYIKRTQGRTLTPAVNYDTVLEDVLGIRRMDSSSYDEVVERMLNGARR